MSETKDNYPQEEEKKLGKDKLSLEEDDLRENLKGLLEKMLDGDDIEEDLPDLLVTLEKIMVMALWDSKFPHFSKTILIAQLMSSYTFMWSYLHEDPRLNRQPRYHFSSDMDSTIHGIAHQTYISVRCMVQGN